MLELDPAHYCIIYCSKSDCYSSLATTFAVAYHAYPNGLVLCLAREHLCLILEICSARSRTRVR